MEEQLIIIRQLIENQDLPNLLRILAEAYPGQIVFSTSFSLEDQLITHFIFSNKINIKVFTLDTGRLFEQTYQLFQQNLDKYQMPIDVYFPDTKELENFVTLYGPNSIYNSVENRKHCCNIRKVEPLKRALATNKIWITGIRAEHSSNRELMQCLEYDQSNNIIKYHPLLNFTFEQVKQQIDEFKIDYNPLHDQGFVSIGCVPCTRAIKPGEDFRAGRWWWEQNNKKECGLHQNK